MVNRYSESPALSTKMRRLARLAIVSLFAAAALCALSQPTVAAELGWIVADGSNEVRQLHTTDGINWSSQSFNIAAGSGLLGVNFVNANDGWAVGEYGANGQPGAPAILNTTNGGATWSPQPGGSSQTNMFRVDFVDPNYGWAVGGNGPNIFSTTNGGATWSTQAIGQTLTGLSFADRNNGWAVGATTIVRTSNGGASWSYQTDPTSNWINGVSAVDANNAWGVGNFGTIIHTANGGASWTQESSGLPNADFQSVTFVNQNDGWLVGSAGQNGVGGVILATTNGGTTWTQQYNGPNGLWDVAFLDPNNGWAVGDDGTILHTTDGGADWISENSGTTDSLRGVSFVNTPEPSTVVLFGAGFAGMVGIARRRKRGAAS